MGIMRRFYKKLIYVPDEDNGKEMLQFFMRWIGILVLIALFLLVIVQPTEAIIINNTTTKNSIVWEWNQYSDPVNVYIDGELKQENSTVKVYGLYNLNDNEEHVITLDTGVSLQNDIAKTNYNPFSFAILVLISVYALFIVLGFIQPLFTIIAIVPNLMLIFELLTNSNDMVINFGFCLLLPITFIIYAYQNGNYS